MELEILFISSIMLLCRSCSVGEMIAFKAVVLPLNMWMLLKGCGVDKDLIYFKARNSASPCKFCSYLILL